MTRAPSTPPAPPAGPAAGRVLRPGGRLWLLALIVALSLAADAVATAAVWVDRRDDPLVPDFRRASLSSLGWDSDPYRDPPGILGFTPILPTGVERDGRGRIRAGGDPADPDVVLRFVLGSLVRHDADGDQRWVRAAGLALDDLVRRSPSGLAAHDTRVTDILGRTVEPPWYAASTQGLMLSALSRMFALTGADRWRVSADGAFAALYAFRGFFSGDKPAPLHWLTSLDHDGYLWFDRFSTGLDTAALLTEQLSAAFGVYDYRRIAARTPQDRGAAASLFAGTVATVEHNLPRYRVPGRISVSSLAAGNRSLRDHAVAEAELGILGRISGSALLKRYSTLYDHDDDDLYFVAKPLTARPGIDVYDPLPPELALPAGRTRPGAVTADGRPTAGPGVTDPNRNAAFALGALDRFRATGDRAWLRRAESAVQDALTGARDGFLTYDYARTNVSAEPLRQPWHSARGQGLMLSALARLATETHDPRWRGAADEVYRALTTVRDRGFPAPRSWLAFMDFSGYLWFEQYADGGQPSLVISGHLDALVGLYDYWSLTNDRTAFGYFQGGVSSLRDALPGYIRQPGGYAVSALGRDQRDPAAHLFLVGQVAALATVTQDAVLTRYASLLAKDYAQVRGSERCSADVRCARLSDE